MAVSDPLRLVGVTLSRTYAVESLVRVDTSTIVYRATHVRTNRAVAVRALSALSAIPDARRRALAEGLARDHAQLTELSAIAPGAYPLRDVGAVGTPQGILPFVVLDWPHGLTLAQLLEPEHGAALPEALDDVVAMLEPIAVALALAHERGVVHGGITPERVLVREDGSDGARRACLLEFGVARVLKSLEGTGEPTPRDDLRALASVLSLLIARSSGADSRMDGARTPRSRGVAVADEVEEVFAGALQRNDYASVGAFWSVLRSTLGLSTLRSLEATLPPESAIASRSLRPIAHSTPPAVASGSRANRSHRLSYAFGGLALAAMVAFTLARTSPAPRAAASVPRAVAAAEAPACPAEMLPIGGASFDLGAAGDAENPPHRVSLRRVCVDRAAVTTSAYATCSEKGACPPASLSNEWEGISSDDRDVLDAFCTARDPQGAAGRPVNCVSWEMAAAYCAQRGARLPTEAEWEIASRSTPASIAEWVGDWRAPLGSEPTADPVGPVRGAERVVRGAHAVGAPPTRFGAVPGTMSHAIGFRCAKSL